MSVSPPVVSCRLAEGAVQLRFIDSGRCVVRLEDVARRALVLRVQRYVMANLALPELSPQLIAAAHHISVRYLHKLFADESTTLSRWILRARLERCRRDLATASAPVGVIAHRWGFTSAARFSRVFKEAYGVSPRSFQAAAGRAAARPRL